MHVTVISPEASMFDGEADAVARMGIQARHRRASSIVARPILRTSSRRTCCRDHCG
jgi:DNA-binding transcriptional LysR family regulator